MKTSIKLIKADVEMDLDLVDYYIAVEKDLRTKAAYLRLRQVLLLIWDGVVEEDD